MSYQERYLAHQIKKKETLTKLIKARHSTRVFSDEVIDVKMLEEIIDSLSMCPSSCDRHGVYTRLYYNRDDKEILAGLLVGGVGWLHRVGVIVLLFGDPEAYRENLPYMPYLDAGVMIYHLYLMAEAYGLKVCCVNPNVREANMGFFRSRFGGDVFCGAVALGYEGNL
jgi:nitroreductase